MSTGGPGTVHQVLPIWLLRLPAKLPLKRLLPTKLLLAEIAHKFCPNNSSAGNLHLHLRFLPLDVAAGQESRSPDADEPGGQTACPPKPSSPISPVSPARGDRPGSLASAESPSTTPGLLMPALDLGIYNW